MKILYDRTFYVWVVVTGQGQNTWWSFVSLWLSHIDDFLSQAIHTVCFQTSLNQDVAEASPLSLTSKPLPEFMMEYLVDLNIINIYKKKNKPFGSLDFCYAQMCFDENILGHHRSLLSGICQFCFSAVFPCFEMQWKICINTMATWTQLAISSCKFKIACKWTENCTTK